MLSEQIPERGVPSCQLPKHPLSFPPRSSLRGAVGPIGRLGGWAARHVRAVSLTWAVLAIGLGLFAPKVETALSGAGWQANGSESVQARTLIQKNFGGLASSAPVVVIHSATLTANSPGFRATVAKAQAILHGDSRISTVVPPRAGSSISADGHTALIVAGAKRTRPQWWPPQTP